MFHSSQPKTLADRRIRCIAALALTLQTVSAGVWISLQKPARMPDQRDLNCQKFKDMMNYSANFAEATRRRFDKELAGYDEKKLPDEREFAEWSSGMRQKAASITGSDELAALASGLAKETQEVHNLFLEAGSDTSPDVEESRPTWVDAYNRISVDFNIALDVFEVDCRGMTLH